ncbi:MAG: anti-sigma factor family protein [Armatimonadota bacterium]
MSCRRVKRLLSIYMDDDCSPGERAQVEEHVEACGDCAGLLDELRRTTELVSSLPAEETSDGFMSALTPKLRELEQAPEPGLLRRAMQWITDSQVRWQTATAGALVLVVAISVVGVLNRDGEARAVAARDAYLSSVVERHRGFAATNLPFDDRAFAYTSYYPSHENGT